MKPLPLVQAWTLMPFVRFLHEIGAPVERWLVASRIHPDVLLTPSRPVPFELVLDFGERAARAEGAESLGIDVGRRSAAEDLGPWGLQLARCPTLYDRALTSCRMLSRFNTGATMWLELDDGWVRLKERFDGRLGPGLRHCEDFSLMLILEAIGRAAGPGWKPAAISLPGPKRERFARDELFQGIRIEYGAHDLEVVFPLELLGRALDGLPADRRRELRSAEGQRGAGPARDFVGSLEDAVLALLPSGCPSSRDIAYIAHTSVRTLQRALGMEGTSLRSVVDRARFRLADDFLRRDDASITDIALDLGYADSTAFTRAFRRMAGMSPGAYRRMLVAGSGSAPQPADEGSCADVRPRHRHATPAGLHA